MTTKKIVIIVAAVAFTVGLLASYKNEAGEIVDLLGAFETRRPLSLLVA